MVLPEAQLMLHWVLSGRAPGRAWVGGCRRHSVYCHVLESVL